MVNEKVGGSSIEAMARGRKRVLETGGGCLQKSTLTPTATANRAVLCFVISSSSKIIPNAGTQFQYIHAIDVWKH